VGHAEEEEWDRGAADAEATEGAVESSSAAAAFFGWRAFGGIVVAMRRG
jgi:hypothetical protein